MRFEDVVKHLTQKAVARVRVGILVEYPLSRSRDSVHVISLGRWGRRYNAPYNMRNVSVVLLADEHHLGVTPVSALQIRWKGWWRVLFGWKFCSKKLRQKFATQMIINCELSPYNKPIQICEKQNSGQYAGGQILNFFVLDLSGQTPDIFALMAYVKALRECLENKDFCVEDTEFFVISDDLRWLAKCYPSHVPKPLKQSVISRQKEDAKCDVDRIKNKIKLRKSESELDSLENDLLEAEDRLRPWLRWWWKTLHYIYYSKLDIFPILKIFVTIFLLGFWRGIIDQIQSPTFIDYTTEGILLYIGLLIWDGFRIFRFLTSWSKKYFIRFSRIEESRDRRTKEQYQNRQMT